DFRNTIIIMTSNVGAHLLRQDKVLGFRPEGEGQNYENMKEQVTGELKRTFRPEFLNRIDDVIVFHALDRQHIHSIVDLMLAELAGKLKELDLTISVTEAARNLLVDQGFDPTYGARPLRRAIQRLIEDEISEELLKGSFAAG
ncbi:MAG TPA: ATP-dependent Clp protease ATP-binding subunit ClpC, partial [Firmicutes bacterium]|nr:ATP-dependent Clp protease ATP-binding subunit ClpC [Bacillota bacterium]